MSLKQRTLNAGFWSLASLIAAQVIRFTANLAMTRLLAPEMFGLMAICTVLLVGLQLFSDLGLRSNVIRSDRGEDPRFLNTVWLVQIIRGAVLWIAATLVAVVLAFLHKFDVLSPASVYADPRLPQVLAAVAITVLITGFGSTKAHEANRKLLFSRVAVVEISSQVIGLGAIFLWLAFDRSIWALVAGNLCNAVASAVLSHVCLSGVSNRFEWDPLAFREIFDFGKWLFISSVLAFLAMNGDRLVLAGLTNTTVLGIYSIALGLEAALDQALSRLISNAAFPAISEIVRNRPSAITQSYYRVHLWVAGAAYFSAGVLLVSGQTLVGALYDARYADAGWMLEVLALGLIAVPFQLAMYTFLALGKPWVNSVVSAGRVVLLFTAMPIGAHFAGVFGAILGLLLSQLSFVPLMIAFSIKYRLFDLRRELMVAPSLIVGLLAGKLLVRGMSYFHLG